MFEGENRGFSAEGLRWKSNIYTFKDYYIPVLSTLFYDGACTIRDLEYCIKSKYKIERFRSVYFGKYTESDNYYRDITNAVRALFKLGLVHDSNVAYNKKYSITEGGQEILFVMEKLMEPEYTHLIVGMARRFPEIYTFNEYHDFTGKLQSK